MPISGCCTYSQTHLAIYSWESFTYQTSYRICVLPGAAYFHTSSLYTNHLASSAVGPNPQITYDYPANLWLQEINVRLHSLDRATSHVHAAVTTAKSGNAESGGEEAATKHRLTACQEGRTVISQTVTLKGLCRPHWQEGTWKPASFCLRTHNSCSTFHTRQGFSYSPQSLRVSFPVLLPPNKILHNPCFS